MKQFTTIEKLDTSILYLLELASSLSVLLLAFGLIASMANVLTKGSVLTGNETMQQIWAWSQCAAIDFSLSGTIIRTLKFATSGEKIKAMVYGLLSALLLFTAAIVSNIEAVQQALNITLDAAYVHAFVPIELLIWVRSLAIVLLIVAHALRYVQLGKPQSEEIAQVTEQPAQSASLVLTPEMIETLRQLLTQTTVTEQPEPAPLQLPEKAGETIPLENLLQELDRLLPHVSLDEITAVASAFKAGVRRREMCTHLKWGGSKYSSIVKPVLDTYERLQQPAE